jgi:hypothetical protein
MARREGGMTMATPDEIKKGLECCSGRDNACDGCPYAKGECGLFSKVATDALVLIQQLEATNAELLTKVEQLEAKCHQLERERDAAVKALVLVDGKVEQVQGALDNDIFYRVDYSTYLSLRNMVDDILSWHYEDDQRGAKGDGHE